MDNETKYMTECEILEEWANKENLNPMTLGEIAAIEKNYKIPSSQVPVPNAVSNYEFVVTDKEFRKAVVERDLNKEYNLKDHPSFGGKVERGRNPLENPNITEISDKKWKEMLDEDKIAETVKERTPKLPKSKSLDNLLSKAVKHEDVNNAYEALRKITNKDNAVGALSVILAERLERLVAKKW